MQCTIYLLRSFKEYCMNSFVLLILHCIHSPMKISPWTDTHTTTKMNTRHRAHKTHTERFKGCNSLPFKNKTALFPFFHHKQTLVHLYTMQNKMKRMWIPHHHPTPNQGKQKPAVS